MAATLRELVKEKREEIMRIASKNRAYNVRIFGSVARGEEREDSDVDFLVDMEPGHSLLDRIGLMQDLEDLLGRKVDVATVKILRDFCRDSPTETLHERILEEAVPL